MRSVATRNSDHWQFRLYHIQTVLFVLVYKLLPTAIALNEHAHDGRPILIMPMLHRAVRTQKIPQLLARPPARSLGLATLGSLGYVDATRGEKGLVLPIG